MKEAQTSAEVLRPTVAQIDLGALVHNFSVIKSYVRRVGDAKSAPKILAAVKANAYGHGMVAVAQQLQRAGVDYLGVATPEEGIELLRNRITVPILVFNAALSNQIAAMVIRHLEITVVSKARLEEIEKVAAELGIKARIHIKVDTGMGRIGVSCADAPQLIEAALRAKHCEIVGIYSHFAMSDQKDAAENRAQLERFLSIVATFERLGAPTPIRHIANSAGLMQLPESVLDMVRPGISLYGVHPSDDYRQTFPLKPVLTLKTAVAFSKRIPPNTGVSYGGTWRASKETAIASLPIGYGDGYLRALSNRGTVLFKGHRCPIRGVVCMDQFMVDTGTELAEEGSEVVLIGEQGGERITVDELAECANTISYEILTAVGARVPRIYFNREGA